jgi:hypothetical protein
VFARANDLYWTPNSTFNEGACGVQTAATDLGFSAAAVTAAFNGVGVSCGGGGGGGGSTGGPLTNGVTVTGINATTGNSVNYTLAVPAGATGLNFVMSGGTGDADHVREVRQRAHRHELRLPSVQEWQFRVLPDHDCPGRHLPCAHQGVFFLLGRFPDG